MNPSSEQSAAFIAGLLLTTEFLVNEKNEPASAAPAGGPCCLGDMDGMD